MAAAAQGVAVSACGAGVSDRRRGDAAGDRLCRANPGRVAGMRRRLRLRVGGAAGHADRQRRATARGGVARRAEGVERLCRAGPGALGPCGDRGAQRIALCCVAVQRRRGPPPPRWTRCRSVAAGIAVAAPRLDRRHRLDARPCGVSDRARIVAVAGHAGRTDPVHEHYLADIATGLLLAIAAYCAIWAIEAGLRAQRDLDDFV